MHGWCKYIATWTSTSKVDLNVNVCGCTHCHGCGCTHCHGCVVHDSILIPFFQHFSNMLATLKSYPVHVETVSAQQAHFLLIVLLQN